MRIALTIILKLCLFLTFLAACSSDSSSISNTISTIPQNGWRLIFVDSEEMVGEDGRAVNAFDGNPDTFWQTEWLNRQTPYPHEIQIDLGMAYTLESFRYLPRQDGNSRGWIKDYAFFVSNSSSNWGGAVAEGAFADSATEKTVVFSTPAIGRYIRIVAQSEISGQSSASMAEINLVGSVYSDPLPPAATINSPIGDLTVTAGDVLFFSANTSDPNGLDLNYHWDFGDPSIPDITVRDPGSVQFSNPGTFTVTFTATNSAGLSEADNRLITVLNPSSSDLIPQTGWSLVYVDSQELVGENGRGVNAFDGNPGTIWHTEWFNNQPPHPHEIQIGLGAIYELSSFRYLPRQDASKTGRIGIHAFYLSLDGTNWGYPVATETFRDSAEEKESFFIPQPARFIRLVTFNSTRGDEFTTMAELNLMGMPFTGNLPPSGVISTPATNLTISTGEWVDFNGAAADPDQNLPLTFHWHFGDPTIGNAGTANPAPVQFNHPGTYTATFTVTDSLGRADAVPGTRVVKVVDSFGDTLIPQANWTLRYIDSQELVGEDGRGVNAFDGDPGTFWQTEWSDNQPRHPHEIQIDLGSAYALDTLHYLPRQDGSPNSRIKDYVVYVSGNGVDWGHAAAMGSFADTATQQTVLFAPKTGRFIRLVSLNEVADTAYASAAEINVEGVCQTPYVKLVSPLTRHLQGATDLTVIAAVCLNHDHYPGWGVKLTVTDNGGSTHEVILTGPPYDYTFQGLDTGEYEVEAFIVDAVGRIVSGIDTHDWSLQVGIGDYYVAIGDSITEGVGDDLADDNQSQDGRNFAVGYTPVLNDRLTTTRGFPHTVVNEGIGGIKSAGGLANLPDVINRYPGGDYYLIQYGTNDSLGPLPVPSGQGLNPGDAGYPGSFKDNMQRIIDTVLSAGKAPYVAKVPFTLSGTTRNNLIRQYNVVIDELVLKNGIEVVPPDFFSYFEANPSELTDTVHPNGQGYQAMANLWHNALTQ